jgi:hypothetical protein
MLWRARRRTHGHGGGGERQHPRSEPPAPGFSGIGRTRHPAFSRGPTASPCGLPSPEPPDCHRMPLQGLPYTTSQTVIVAGRTPYGCSVPLRTPSGRCLAEASRMPPAGGPALGRSVLHWALASIAMYRHVYCFRESTVYGPLNGDHPGLSRR